MGFGCSICQDPFGDSDSSVTNCGHIYHHRCILDWINRNRSCPSCRTSCAPSHLKRLYFSSVHDDKPLRLDYEYDYDRYFGECAEEALKSYNEDLNRENRKLQSQLKMLENNKNQKIKSLEQKLDGSNRRVSQLENQLIHNNQQNNQAEIKSLQAKIRKITTEVANMGVRLMDIADDYGR